MTSSKVVCWLAINILGIVLYLYFASKIWAPAGEAGLVGGPGDSFIWVLTALPVLAINSLINVVILLFIFVTSQKNQIWKFSIIWIFVVTAWFGAYRYDVYRQYTGEQLAQPCLRTASPAPKCR